jgi:ABC-type xylose transport system permease subunit
MSALGQSQINLSTEPGNNTTGWVRKTFDWRTWRSLIALAAVMLVLAVLTEGTFLSARNLTNLTRQVAINGVLAVGMTFVILIGGIDLSVGSVVALAGIIAGLLQVNAGLAQWPEASGFLGAAISVGAAGAIGALCGVFNGWMITRHRIAPFIITLGMMVIARGLALILSGGAAIAPLSDAFNELGQGYLSPEWSVGLVSVGVALATWIELRGKWMSPRAWLGALPVLGLGGAALYAFQGYRGIPYPVLIFSGLALVGATLLNRVRFGRFVMAVGGNPEAAWLAGVPIRKVTFLIYVAMGCLAGLSGAILSARLNGALPTAGELFELDAIAAVVIGGTSLLGGVGSVRGSIIGAFFIGAMNNGMSLMDITEFYQKVIKGVIIILAVWFDTRQQSSTGRAAPRG